MPESLLNKVTDSSFIRKDNLVQLFSSDFFKMSRILFIENPCITSFGHTKKNVKQNGFYSKVS